MAGILVGAMNAIAGGGMLIGFPVMLATGISPLVANVTSHFIVIPGQVGAIIGYRKYLRKVPKSYALLIIPCAIGGAIGATILKHTSSARFETLVPVLMLTAVILFAFQPFLHFHLHRHLKGRAKSLLPVLLIGCAFLPIAVYGGFFGVGFGFVIMAFLGFAQIHDIHLINALKCCSIFSISIVSAGLLARTGLVDWVPGSFMAAGCALGGYFGSRLAQRFSTHAIRIVVITIGLLAAGYLSLRTY
ncbi:MAG: sulfite exporter TauE/SafE family protein [Patescibacteria group bacterium]